MPIKELLICTFACACLLSHSGAALISHWKFDESTGTIASDETTNNNDGAWVPSGGNPSPNWQPAGGLFGGALELPGSGNHVNYFTVSGFQELNGTPAGMTISVWVKAGDQSGYRGILMTRGVTDNSGSGKNYGLAHDSTGADGRVSGQSVDSLAGTLVDNGEWIHVAWVWDNVSQTHKMYIDGQQSGATQSVSTKTISANSDWRIGDDACCDNRNFNGLMDDLAVWDEPLSASAVQQIYDNGIAGLGIGDQPSDPPTDPLEAGLVINEVHYDAEPKTEFVEFVELLNTNSTGLDISGYAFTNGVTFIFPAGTTLAPAEYVIVAENPAALAAKFSLPPGTQVLQYSGSLSNAGETLELRDAAASVIDTVNYRAEFPWPISPNGEADSMQLINATLDNNLGGAWRGSPPTPGLANSAFATTAPPIIRQVDHSPKAPLSSQPLSFSAKVTDPDGVASVSLLYQIVAPGAFIPAYFPQPYSQLLANPEGQGAANPAFENPANWTTVAMVDDGTGKSTFTATIPAQAHRTLVRYRIVAEDSLAESVRVPYPDDDSLNFAAFVYDGVPDYVTGGTTHSAEVLTELPVYQMITRDADRAYAYAYESTGDNFRIGKGHAARRNYNWECALVYDGVVYDHVGWRLRQNNDRYAGNGKRSMRFRMNRGHYFQARGEDGEKLAVKWRRFNTSKMSRFGGTNSYGLYETINSRLWRMVGVECPYFLPAHWRMIDGADEAPDPYNGDFFGFTTIVQDIDGRLLDERGLPNGNMYKLKDGATNPLELQRNQSRIAVSDGSDFTNIKNNLNGSQGDAWLNDHVDWEQWARYHAVVEAVRHYDYGTPETHFKNRAWYFKEQAGTPHGLLRIVPHDHDASWSKGYHDNLNSVGNSIGTGFPWAAIFGGNTRPPASEKVAFTKNYRNFIREFRQLLWQEETVNTMIDDHVARLQLFTLADRDRWTGGPAAAGSESMTAIENIAAPMRSIAFVSDTMYGSNLVGGRGAFLDQIGVDAQIPNKPTITYSGAANFPAGGLQFASSAFADPQGAGTFAAMQWRIAEVTATAGGGGDTEILARGSVWKYLDNGSDQGTAWRAAGFDDSAFLSGATPAGFGGISNTVLQTQIDFGGNPSDRFPTTYFRTTVNIMDAAEFGSFTFSLNLDDGAVVYVNGQEVLRDGIAPGSPVAFNTFADSSGNEGVYDSFTVLSSAFVAGENTIAVEVHNQSAGSGDLGFDMEIFATPATPERKFEWLADWDSGNLAPFQSTVAPPAAATRAGRIYRARVRHQDNSGRWSNWSEPLEFAASLPDISLFTDSLVISEIMYHPSDPTAAEIAAGFDDDDLFEYIEIRNVGTQAIDLSDVRFTKGIDIDLGGTVAPGAFVLVVKNAAAFEMRYGAGMPVVGEWSGKLDNGGEQLKLSFGAGVAIRDFVYDDVAPWPTAPDGAGSSLVLVDPFGLPDHGSPFSWRAGNANPGNSDGTTLPPGGDLLEYAIQARPVATLQADGNIALTTAINQLAEDLIIRVQSSTDLDRWTDSDLAVTATTPTSGGFASTTFTTPAPPEDSRFFLRLLIIKR